MNMRNFLKLSALSMTFAFSRRLMASERKPNVLFIALDDMNDWISSLGGYPKVMH